jgi:hypothetical protein
MVAPGEEIGNSFGQPILRGIGRQLTHVQRGRHCAMPNQGGQAQYIPLFQKCEAPASISQG